MTDFLKLAQEAYQASTEHFETALRSDLDYAMRAFRNEHASNSKYLSEQYKGRSRLFRPKTRSIIRKNEAAAAVALFSNMEIVNVSPQDPDDMMNVIAAQAMKYVLEYRLTHTIPAYQICLGGIQDAQTTGMVCSYQFWEYKKIDGRKIIDQPCIELRPFENIRIDHGASWLDPVNTTPYFGDIIPMYVCDVKSMMDNTDDKTNQPAWKKYDEAAIAMARPENMELRDERERQEQKNTVKHFDIVWVLRWFIKDSQSEDYCFYTLGTEKLLTEPKPIDEIYFHGKRPYVMGYAILETHKALKTSLPVLTKPLQQEVNNIANQRLDNVSFVLNKRWFVARGRNVDTKSLVLNVPGGVTLMNDPKNDVQESNWPDVTSSSYAEHDRMNAEFDDLAGNFSPSTRVANNAVNDTLGGAKMATQSAGIMTDYLLRTVIETWWEPVLNQLVLLEKHYETDDIVLSIAAKKAKLFPRFAITDDLLMQDVNVNVNVGMGASNPQQRQQNFLNATQAAVNLIGTAPPGANVQEMIKEIYSNAGYRDGVRFFSQEQDPRLIRATQMVQQLQQLLKGKQMELQAQGQLEQLKLLSNEKIKGAELNVDIGRISGDLRIRAAELVIEEQKLELEKIKMQIDSQSSEDDRAAKQIELASKIEEAQAKIAIARLGIEKTRMDIYQDMMKMANELAAGTWRDSAGGRMIENMET